jgi:hypothetical protein
LPGKAVVSPGPLGAAGLLPISKKDFHGQETHIFNLTLRNPAADKINALSGRMSIECRSSSI